MRAGKSVTWRVGHRLLPKCRQNDWDLVAFHHAGVREGSRSLMVGSRAGAVFLRSGLSVSPRFLWECLINQTVNPFPAPATSHPACGFAALGAPVCFVSRFMGPILLGRLSRWTIDEAGSR
jgi:hypothetical protein